MGINIVQKTKDFGMDSVKFGKVHGQTKIELYDVNKKIKKVYMDENTFQSNILANYMKFMGSARHVTAQSWNELVGGLLLFRDAITVGSHFMPSTNTMVGNGSYEIVNNNYPTELGSYNSVESSATENAITQVYDFSTSQANGTIGCVCLTSRNGGFIGYGNGSGQSTTNSVASMVYNQESQVGLGGMSETIVGDIKYSFSISSGNLVVSKQRLNINTGSIFYGFSKTVNIELTAQPVTFSGKIAAFKMSDSIIRLAVFYRNNITVGDTTYYIDYNLTNDSISYGSFTNASGITLKYDWRFTVFTTDGYLMLVSNDRNMQDNSLNYKYFVIKLSTSEVVYINETFGAYYDVLGRGYFQLSDGLMFVTRETARYTYMPYVMNYISGNVKPLNLPSYSAGYTYFVNQNLIDSMIFTISNPPKIYKNPLYLATINNLETAVTKTSAQTMKVTYTLTEASE